MTSSHDGFLRDPLWITGGSCHGLSEVPLLIVDAPNYRLLAVSSFQRMSTYARGPLLLLSSIVLYTAGLERLGNIIEIDLVEMN